MLLFDWQINNGPFFIDQYSTCKNEKLQFFEGNAAKIKKHKEIKQLYVPPKNLSFSCLDAGVEICALNIQYFFFQEFTKLSRAM